jgi:hypothetical protein
MQISKNDPTEYNICGRCVFEISNPNFNTANERSIGKRIEEEQLKYEKAIELEHNKLLEKIKKEQQLRKELDIKKKRVNKEHKDQQKILLQKKEEIQAQILAAQKDLTNKQKDTAPIRKFLDDEEQDIKSKHLDYAQLQNSARKLEDEKK